MQLCGAHMDTMTRCAEIINTHTSVDFVDINVGCPIDLVFKKVSTVRCRGCRTIIFGGLKCCDHTSNCPILMSQCVGVSCPSNMILVEAF